MRRAAALLVAIALAAPAVAGAKPPVLVELFTAQGCSSCGKVDAIVDQIAANPGIIALTWPVDYWDYLGWKDTFAKAEFTERQRAYDRRFGLRDVYTPQVVVDGRFQTSGATPGAIDDLVAKARRVQPDAPDMQFVGSDRVAVGSGPRPTGGAEVWLIRYDPRAQQVEVTEGDNRGQTVRERNVVRQADRLGVWKGLPVLLKAPAAEEEGLASLVVLQGARGGGVIGVLLGDAEAKP
jgi:hypothetical protein